jgi:hypothetical protein
MGREPASQAAQEVAYPGTVNTKWQQLIELSLNVWLCVCLQTCCYGGTSIVGSTWIECVQTTIKRRRTNRA